MSESTITRSMTSTLENVLLLLDPHGGQRVARRNALWALHSESSAARDRQQAFVALAGQPAAAVPVLRSPEVAARP